MEQLTVSAPAKLNLALDVLRLRPDGYHDLKMVMQTISLCDAVTVRGGTGTGKIEVRMPGSDLPTGPENIAYRAAHEFFTQTGISNDGVEITIAKYIPIQAGMAGGSADGAATLRALRVWYGAKLSTDDLERIGESVGSDVPFCVRGGTVLAEGRGEILTDLPALPACWIAACKPAFGLSTPELFDRVQVEKIRSRPDFQAMYAALQRLDLAGVAGQLRNVFEEFLTEEEHREIRTIQDTMRWHGALGTVMTGSGPTVFGLFYEKKRAQEAVEALKPQFSQTFLAVPCKN